MEDANKLYETMKEFSTEQIQDCTEKIIQQKAAKALSEISRLDGEDNLLKYILCLLKYSILPAYAIKDKNTKTRLMKHLPSHAGYELIRKEIIMGKNKPRHNPDKPQKKG